MCCVDQREWALAPGSRTGQRTPSGLGQRPGGSAGTWGRSCRGKVCRGGSWGEDRSRRFPKGKCHSSGPPLYLGRRTSRFTLQFLTRLSVVAIMLYAVRQGTTF